MKVIILAGGLGSRLSEETHLIPKPMVEIGNEPIIWHIMKIYSKFGFKEFFICCGYKSEIIKNYFLNYKNNKSDLKISLKKNKIEIMKTKTEDWEINLIETGDKSLTGSRLGYIKKFLKKNENFMMTYGDGLADINIKKLVNSHLLNKKLVTMTVVDNRSKYGMVKINKKKIKFNEKIYEKNKKINAGFFVINEKCLQLIKNDKNISWEYNILPKISKKNQLSVFCHNGYWKSMDTLKDKIDLNQLWNTRKAFWKIW